MRTRHSTGGVRKQRGRWIGLWYEGGVKKSRVLGFVKDLSKGEAREAVAKIVAAGKAKTNGSAAFGQFVEDVYFRFYTRKWKASTRENNVNRINVHLVRRFEDRELTGFQRTSCRTSLTEGQGLSFSVVDHLRWT